MIRETVWTNTAGYSDFHGKIMVAFNAAFPEKVVRSNTKKNRLVEWHTPDITRLKHLLDAIHITAQVTQSEEAAELYQRYKNEYKETVRNAKREVISRQIEGSENKHKAVWSAINKEFRANVKNSKPTNLSADKLNKHFCEVSTNGPCQQAQTFLRQTHAIMGSFYITPVTPNEIRSLISCFKSSKTPDVYGMSPYLMKEVCDLIAGPLAHHINNCFSTGIYPDELKLARVIPVHKTGDNNTPNNYRPISIMPTFSKVFEKAILNRLMEYLERKNLISCAQHGFRSNRSTVTAVTEMVELIVEALDRGDDCCLVCCDLSKAFDCVNHTTLLAKLDSVGVRGMAKQLFESYLSNRKQMVDLGIEKSQIRPVSAGVAQGSVLAALLFLIFINDLPHNISETNISIYADDTSLLTSSKNKEDLTSKTQKAQAEAAEWFSANSLMLNVGKTQELIITTRRYDDLNQGAVSFLGVTINQELNWKDHISAISKKLTPAIFAIRRIRKIATQSAAISTYHAFFMSRATYAIIVWGASREAQRVFVLQKEAVRAATGAEYRASCRNIFKSNKLITIPSAYILACIIYVHSNRHKYRLRQDIHNYDTRTKSQIDEPMHRISKTQSSTFHVALKLYNSLPEEVKNRNMREVKAIVKRMLVENAFYSIEEFLQFLNGDSASGAM